MLLLSAFFSGSEMAFLSSNKLMIELNRKKAPRTAKIIDLFMSDSGTLIATILVGNNIALVVYGLVFAPLFAPFLGEAVTGSASLSLLLQTITSTIIIIVTAEFLPKALMQHNPTGMLTLLAMPLMLFYIILYPIARAMQWLAHLFITKVLRHDIPDGEDNILPSRVDLDQLLSDQAEAAVDSAVDDEVVQEARLMKNALDFGMVKVRDCTIPRTEIEAVDVTDSVDELRDKFIKTGFSKILVYEDTIDNIIGYVHVSSLFAGRGKVKKKQFDNIRSMMISIAVVPETMEARTLLKRFTSEHKSIALVVDEFGGTAGMVTFEDVLEEIFGEIDDEHDVPEYVERQIAEGEYAFSGRLEIDYLNEKYNLNLPVSDDYDTLAGLILNETGSIPRAGDVVETEAFEFRILVASHARIDTIKVIVKR